MIIHDSGLTLSTRHWTNRLRRVYSILSIFINWLCSYYDKVVALSIFATHVATVLQIFYRYTRLILWIIFLSDWSITYVSASIQGTFSVGIVLLYLHSPYILLFYICFILYFIFVE